MKQHFSLMAEYNAWANARLYRMAAQLSDVDCRRDVHAYFKSLHGTLNHLLVADRIWLHRLTGAGAAPTQLNVILYEDLSELTEARRVEDERLATYVNALTDAQLEAPLELPRSGGALQREVLAHLFNHQTHHRGQAHAILTTLGVQEPESLDVLWMLRERQAR